MISLIKGFFGISEVKPTTEFSLFFNSASSEEKKKLFKEVLRKANEDQRELVRKYNAMKTKTA